MGDRFNWAGPEVVIHRRAATAVYANEAGGVTIRQEDTSGGPADIIINFELRDLPGLIAKLRRICAESAPAKGSA